MANHAFASNGACQEVEFYRRCSHPQVPKLLYAQANQVFAEGALIGPGYKGASLFFEVCNGHTMERLADRADFKPSTLFIWRIFDQLVDTFAFLHRNDVAHTNAHLGNIFLHFPDADAKLPDVVLGGFGNNIFLSSDIWKDSNRTELKDDCDERSFRPLLEDLAWMRSAVADLLSLSDPTVEEDPEEDEDEEDALDVVEVLREVLDDNIQNKIDWGKHPRELYQLWARLDQMIQGMLEKGLHWYREFHNIRRDVADMRLREETRLQFDQVQDLRPLMKSLEKSAPSLSLDREPYLFSSRTELESYAESEQIRGPYRIARIDPSASNKIISIDIFDHGLFHAEMWHMDVPVFSQHLLPILKERQKYDWRSWPDVVRLADKLLDGIVVPKESFCPFGRRWEAMHGPVDEETVNKFFQPDPDWYTGQTYSRSGAYEILYDSKLSSGVENLSIDDDNDDDLDDDGMSITTGGSGMARNRIGKKRKRVEVEEGNELPVTKRREAGRRE